MSKLRCYTLSEVLADMFVDEDSDLEPDAADSLSNSNEHGCETGRL